jgi:5-formyltetrahydrofolate cyclo-ligase
VPDYSDIAGNKADLRGHVLAARRSLSGPAQAAAATRVRRTAVDLVRRLAPAVVTGYVPVGTEPGGAGLPEALAGALPHGGRLLLPVLLPDLDLDWAAWTPGVPLVAAGRGLREPAGPRLGPAAVATATVVLVPALAVDRHGRRLGRGGGSYDRALARVSPRALAIALLHDGELVAALPAESHDRPVSAVITPATGLVRLDGGASDAAVLALG